MRDLTVRRSLAMVALAASTWGTWSLFLRPAERLGPVAPAAEAVVLFVVTGVAIAPFALRERTRAAKPFAAWAVLALSGVVDAGNVLCFFGAMQRTSLAIAVLTHYLAPVIVAVVAPVLLGEPRRRETLGALAASLAGLTLVLAPWRSVPPGAAMGAALGAASAVFYAGNVLATKRLAAWLSPPEIVAWHSFLSAALVLPFVPAGGMALAPAQLAWIGAGAMLPGAAAGLVFMRGLARAPASAASTLTLLEPLVAVAIGVAVWGEPLRATTIAGALLVLGGAWAVLRGGPTHEAAT